MSNPKPLYEMYGKTALNFSTKHTHFKQLANADRSEVKASIN